MDGPMGGAPEGHALQKNLETAVKIGVSNSNEKQTQNRNNSFFFQISK